MGELFRKFRWWCHNEDHYPFHRSLLRRKLENVFLDYARWRSRDAKYCWANAATWAMGFDGELLTPSNGCCWCGKCPNVEARP